jgi:hypothetical protein
MKRVLAAAAFGLLSMTSLVASADPKVPGVTYLRNVQAPILRKDSFGVPLVNQAAYTKAMKELPQVHANHVRQSPQTAVAKTSLWLTAQGFKIGG